MEKKMYILSADNLRQLVKKSNELSIQKEDIVQIIQLNGSFILVYFK